MPPEIETDWRKGTGKTAGIHVTEVMMCLGRASLSTLALRLLDEADRKHWSNERIYSAAAAACEGESLWKDAGT